jgi:hypothetical protein
MVGKGNIVAKFVFIEPYWINADAVAYLGTNPAVKTLNTLINFAGSGDRQLAVNLSPRDVAKKLS